MNYFHLMEGVSFIVEKKLNETEQNKLTDLIAPEFKKYEIFAYGGKKLKEEKPIKFLNIKNTKKRTQYALKLCGYDTICIIRNINILFSKIKAISELLNSNDMIIGEIESKHYNFYTKHITKQHIGFLLFSKKTLLKRGFLKNYPDFKNLKIGYAEIPLREEIKVPKIFRPLNTIFSFLVYPHASEKKEINISIGEDDYLYIPEIYSAKKTLTIENIQFLSVLGIVCIALLGGFWHFFGVNPLIIFIGFCTFFYLFSLFFKLDLVFNAINYKPMKFSEEEIKRIDDKKLPVYTLLIPLYKETEVLKQIVSAIQNLDWPKNKLDVKFLLEEDDSETIKAVKKMKLPEYFEIVILPNTYPKTKPKALNVGLTKVKGEYLVLYDAEDMPERDQLKKAYLAFKKLPEKYACVQAKLNYYNKDQNILTKLFTSEYCTWFDLYLPGLMARNYPIPLGGTSNHFKVEIIKKLGGWDPYNVTEDCDLGMRIYKKGYDTGIIESTTWEEANSKLHGWIRQRSRWVKGYIQTSLVHLRHPVRSLKEFRLKNFFAFLFFVGGTPLIPILNLFFWALTILWFTTNWLTIKALFPPIVFYPGLFSLVIGNFIFIYLSLLGCVEREFYNLIKWSLLAPFYWLLMGFASIKAFAQLIKLPHFWEKTTHGFHLIEKKEAGFLKKTKILKLGSFVKTGILKLAKAYNRLDKHLERKIEKLKKKLAKYFKKFTTNRLMKRWRK